MIASAGISLLIMAVYGQRTLPADLTQIDIAAAAFFAAALIILRIWKVSPIKLMLGTGVVSVALSFLL